MTKLEIDVTRFAALLCPPAGGSTVSGVRLKMVLDDYIFFGVLSTKLKVSMQHVMRLQSVALTLGLVIGSSKAQTTLLRGTRLPTVTQVKPAPDDVLYRMLFHEAVGLETFGDQLEAKGHTSKFIRAQVQEHAELTTHEATLLKKVSKDWIAKEMIYFQERGAIMNSGQPVSITAPQQVALKAKFDADELAEINQLKTSLGPDRFAVLDHFVHSEIAKRTVYAEVRRRP